MAAAGSNYNIVISALDNTSSVVAKINAQIGKITKPIRDVQASATRLSRELGFDQIGTQLGRVTSSVVNVSRQLHRTIEPLAEVTSLATVAGVIALADSWGQVSRQLTYASAASGVATTRLQQVGFAARAMGLDSKTAENEVGRFGQTMEDAMYGRNQRALAAFQQSRTALGHFGKDLRDPIDAMKDYANYIKSIGSNPYAQNAHMSAVGIGPEMMPFYRQGGEAIENYIKMAKQAAPSADQIARGDKFAMSLSLMRVQWEKMSYAIGDRLLPVLGPLIDKLTAWMGANQGRIADGIGRAITGLHLDRINFDKVFDGLVQFGHFVKGAINFVGGFKAALIGLVIFMNAGLLLSVFNLGRALTGLGWAVAAGGLRLFATVAEIAVGGALKGLIGAFIRLFVMARAGGLLEAFSAAVVGVFEGLSVAIEATPIGWIITAIAGLGLAAYELYEHWSWFARKWHELWGLITGDASDAADSMNSSFKLPDGSTYASTATGATPGLPSVASPGGMPNNIGSLFGGGGAAPNILQGSNASPSETTAGTVMVTFQNAPSNIRVSTTGNVGAKIQYALPPGLQP